MKKAEVLTIVISVLVLGLAFAGLKLANSNKGGKGSDGDSAKVTAEADVTGNTEEVERRLIGYWAVDPSKLVKELEANPPEGASEEQLAEMKDFLLSDKWEEQEKNDMAAMFLYFEERGAVSFYTHGGRMRGSYSIKVPDGKDDKMEVDWTITNLGAGGLIDLVGLSEKEKEDSVARMLDEWNTTEKFRLFLNGETVQAKFPGEPLLMPLSRIKGSEVTKRKDWIRDAFLRVVNEPGVVIVGEGDDPEKTDREEEQRKRELEQLKDEWLTELGLSGEE